MVSFTHASVLKRQQRLVTAGPVIVREIHKITQQCHSSHKKASLPNHDNTPTKLLYLGELGRFSNLYRLKDGSSHHPFVKYSHCTITLRIYLPRVDEPIQGMTPVTNIIL